MAEVQKIGLDGRCFTRKKAGIVRYVTELCRALDRALPQALFFAYSLAPAQVPLPSERWFLRTEPSALGRRLFRMPLSTSFWYRYRVGSLCAADGVGAYWANLVVLPRLPPGIRTLVTVYDLNLALVPETMPWRAVLAHRLFFRRSLAEATAIDTISSGTAKRLHELFGYEAQAVVKPAVSAHFRPRPPAEVEACLERYGVRRPYLLAIGTWEPRKNLALLVQSFIQMKAEGLLAEHSLVLAGARGWRDTGIASIVRKAAESGVKPLGYVPDEDLPALYSGCRAFVFPSLYEGFGLPVLEARACGARVIATDIPEIREAGGDDTIYIRPTAEGIRAGVMTALARQNLKNSAKPVAATWEESAAILGRLLLSDDPSMADRTGRRSA